MRKAAQALASAHQLLAGGDADGACNRAYYAMFDAAHAALRSANVAETASATKTHRGLIAAFGQHLVLGGHVASELGSSLNKVERLPCSLITRVILSATMTPYGQSGRLIFSLRQSAMHSASRSRLLS